MGGSRPNNSFRPLNPPAVAIPNSCPNGRFYQQSQRRASKHQTHLDQPVSYRFFHRETRDSIFSDVPAENVNRLNGQSGYHQLNCQTHTETNTGKMTRTEHVSGSLRNRSTQGTISCYK